MPSNSDMAYNVSLPVFEGPLDLLLHLIDKAQLDIYDIPIAMIAEQYLSYIRSMQHLDMEIASEFLVMAATLLQIKSRMLLPQPPKLSELQEAEDADYDPRQELVQRLIEYRQFKQAAGELAVQQRLQMKVFSRQPLRGPWNDQPLPLEGLSLDDLFTAFIAVLQGQEEVPAMIEREEYTVKDKMQEILRRVRIKADNGLHFSTLFGYKSSRSEKITSFLALLELMRMRLIIVRQTGRFGEIMLQLVVQQQD